jgi:hypothetical protein
MMLHCLVSGVEAIFSNPQCCTLGDHTISIREHYDFFLEEEMCAPPSSSSQPSLSPQATSWGITSTPISPSISSWLQQTDSLLQLNSRLLGSKAEGFIDEGATKTPLLKIEPLGGSSEMTDWSDQTKSIMQGFLSEFKEDTVSLPGDGASDIIEHARSEANGCLFIEASGHSLKLAGNMDVVDDVMTTVNEMISEYEVDTEDGHYQTRIIKYLKKFSTQKVNAICPPVKYEFNSDSGVVTVTAKKKARTAFWNVIEDEIKGIQEKIMELEHTRVFKWLNSSRGIALIEEAIGLKSSDVVYEFEEDPPSFRLHILSPPHKKEVLKFVKRSLERLYVSKKLPQMDRTKFRFCSDSKWKKMVEVLQKDAFFEVTVDNSSQSVTVTGQEVIVESVIPKLRSFLLQQTIIEEQVSIGYHQWRVIHRDMTQEVYAIQQRNEHDVRVQLPKKPSELPKDVSVNIIIRGEPERVDEVKGQFESLSKRVFHKEGTFRLIPAASAFLDSMKDKIDALESQHGASIDAKIVKNPSGASQNPAGLTASRICSATFHNDVRISVYCGDFTKHSQVDAIVVFIPPNPKPEDNNLKMLFSAGGSSVQNDFKARSAELLQHCPCDTFQSDPGKLQSGKLCHYFLPPWKSTPKKDEDFYFASCLEYILSSATTFNSVILTSICSSPLKYPADVFARNVISSVGSCSYLPCDLTVVIYVNEVAHAREFEIQFKESDYCRTTVPQAKVFTQPTSSYLTLTKGDILQQTVSLVRCAWAIVIILAMIIHF